MGNRGEFDVIFPGKEMFVQASMLPDHFASRNYDKILDNLITSMSNFGYEIDRVVDTEGYSIKTFKPRDCTWRKWQEFARVDNI